MEINRGLFLESGNGGEFMEEKNVTLRIVEYLMKNKISIRQVSLDTDIPEKKLSVSSPEKLDALEFLSLCAYLGLDPKEI